MAPTTPAAPSAAGISCVRIDAAALRSLLSVKYLRYVSKHSCQLDGFFGALTYSAAPADAVYEADNLEAFRLRPEMHGSCIVVQDPLASALLLSAML